MFVRAREDPATFGDVYLQYRDKVLGYFAKRVLDPELAFDLMGETFAEIFSSIRRFKGTNEIQGQAFMWAIARTQLASWRRRGEIERRNLERLGVPVPSLGPEEYERIEQLADLERIKPHLERALRELTEAQRHVLAQHIGEGRSYEELADELGTTAVALRNMSSRALRRLSSVLADFGVIDPDETERHDPELVQ